MNKETRAEMDDILIEIGYREIFIKLKNLPSVISNIKIQRDNKKNEKQCLTEELNHHENELLETVYIEAMKWKELKKLNNDESRKNYLEILKYKDSAYQVSKARLSTIETELNKLNTAYEEASNRLKTNLALKDMVVARIELINEFKSGQITEVKEEEKNVKPKKLPEIKINKENMEHIELGH